MLPIAKKGGGIRVCVDYSRLNLVTERDQFALPLIDDILSSFHGCTVFSTLDAFSGFWQVPVAPEDRQKTAFSVPGMGLYEFRVMPFGLVNAPSTFRRAVQEILGHLSFVHVYVDDILVFSRTPQEHLHHLRRLFA